MTLWRRMPRPVTETVLGAIDVGTNAVRLELARYLPDGALEVLHQERDPVRPGEGVFKTGSIPKEVADRLIATLRRYSALANRYHAQVRAVATSAVREAKNRDEIVRRARDEAGLKLEVISGKEEARLITLGVLHGKPAMRRSLCVDIGGGSTEVASAVGERPEHLWSVALGAVQLTETFDSAGKVSDEKLALMRNYAMEALRKTLPAKIPNAPKTALGSSGTINALVSYAAEEGTAHATRKNLTRAVDSLVAMTTEERRRTFDNKRADIIVAGAVVLEAVVEHLNLTSVTAVDRGLRDGVLFDLVRRQSAALQDTSLADAAVAIGRRLFFDEPHSKQIHKLAMALFDDLSQLHKLPASDRPYLEVAALLHDIGNAVSYHRHHRHTQYLIQNTDIPGLADRERELVARIARYHRRSAPDLKHAGMGDLSASEVRSVRKLAILLRVADSLDSSHRQPISSLKATDGRGTVTVRLQARAPVDLEMWDVEHELEHFRKVFGKKLVFEVKQPKAKKRRA